MGGGDPEHEDGEGEALSATGLAETLVGDSKASGAPRAGPARLGPGPGSARPSEEDTLIGSLDPSPLSTDETLVAGAGSGSESGAGAEPGQRLSETTQIPERIGKYRVLRPLGEGGMGTVFAARDEELDREVAIKLVRPRGVDGEIGDAATLRLLREAKALAKISHPNVIHVYEVGTWRSRVYVAMELVDGWTLGRFQYRNVSRWQDLLEIYKAAGRGLAAAHAGGLVHRDFKPDNVLVTPAGEPRVIDFGLARTIGAGEVPDAVEAEAEVRPELMLSDEMQLTQTGTVLGTPAYMAPEQHRGQATDARTDQFSFCVALYEALYAQRPFAGSTFAELTYNVLHGKISEPPPFITVPRWIRRVLLRGLSVDPDDRYEDMEALLDALDYDPVRRWRVIGLTLGTAVLAGVALASWRAVEHRRLRLAEAERLRAEFDAQRLHDQELQIRAAQTRSVFERHNDFVIAAARARMAKDPTAALAVLKHLDPRDESVMPEALALAGEALGRGVVDVDLRFDAAAELIVFSRGGQRVLVGDAGGGLRLVDCDSGEVAAELRVPAKVAAAVFMADDAALVVGDSEGGLHLFSAAQLGLGPGEEKGEGQGEGQGKGTGGERAGAALEAAQHEGVGQAITALAAAPSGDRLAVGDASGVVSLWSTSSLSLDRRLIGHEAAITALSFDSHAGRLFSADASGLMFGRDLDAESKWTLESEQVVEGLHLVEGQRLVGWRGGDTWQWDRRKGTRYPVTSEGEAHLEVLDDALVGVDATGTLRVRVDGQVRAIVEGLAPWQGPFAVAPDRQRFAFGDARGRFVLRRLGDTSGIERFGSEARAIEALALANRHAYLALSTRRGAFELHELDGGEGEGEGGELPELPGELAGGAKRLSFSAADGYLLATRDQTRLLWSLADGAPLSLPPGRCETKDVAWSADDARLAIAECSVDGGVELFSTAGELLHRLALPGVSHVQLDASGAQLLAASLGYRQQLIHVDVDGGGDEAILALDELPVDEPWPLAVAFALGEDEDEAPGGVRLATYSGERLHVWHWQPGTGQVALVSDETLVATPDFSDARPFVVLPIEDGLLRFWDLGRNHSVVLGDLGRAFASVERAHDGRSLLLVADEGAEPVVHHVDLETGAARRFTGPVPFMAISGDGSTLARRFGGVVEVWRDPAPQDIDGFLAWLDEQTIQVLPADALL